MSSQPLLKFIAGMNPIFTGEYAVLSAPVRHIFMIATVWYLTQERKISDFQVLEIGSWVGASALSWAQGIKLYNDSTGTVTCLDAWQPFFNRATHEQDVYTTMEQALSTETAYQLFNHNISTIAAGITCQHLRGTSNNLLPLLRQNTFNVVFIDGDHTYTAVLNDIKKSLALVKEGGIICGDDLNLQLSQVDQTNARLYAEKDFIKDPKTNRNFHPGVTLAVAEIFGDVSVFGGFWAMQRQGNAWKKISLKNMPIQYPEHLPPHVLQKAKEHLADIAIL